MASKSTDPKAQQSAGGKITSDISNTAKNRSISKDGKKAASTSTMNGEKADTAPSEEDKTTTKDETSAGDETNAEDESASFSASYAIPDTLDARLALHKMHTSASDQPNKSSSSSQPVAEDDGPLLFALLLNNQNNNNSAPAVAPAPDTLDAKQAVYEVTSPKVHDEMSDRLKTSSGSAEQVNGDDGPLLLALLMGNNNNNANAAAQPAPEPVPDTLDARFAVYEVLSPQHATASLNSHFAVTELTNSQSTTTPPVLRMRGAAQTWVPDETQVQFWKDNGYLVVPDALTKETVAELLQCVNASAEAIATGGAGIKRQEFNQWDKGCVNPNGRVIAALTEHAFKPNTTPLQHIQRLGCGIHRVLPHFRRAIMSAQNVAIAQALGYKDPRVVQSLIVVKAAHVGGEIVPHQDGCTSFTDPPSNTTFWYALEDANKSNGCLAVAPGSHRVTPIPKRCRTDEKGLPVFELLQKPIFAEIEGVSSDAPLPQREENGEFKFKELEVEAGTLVLMHANLMHTSAANQSDKSRVAFHFGLVEGGLEWREDNYLQPADGETEFEKLHVC